ncbi:hypothetical protein [Agrococcus sediminis]|uniref:hypothetical protein n=1 Tax=Agrococcus sediminis TaxID=2599924 RepID=UPI00341B9F23
MVRLRDLCSGKLVWTDDWPMRWASEKVVFEPSGVDHQSPSSSFQVGLELAPVFGWQRPLGSMYAFVGFGGVAKMSSSCAGAPVPADALAVIEAPVLRPLRPQPHESALRRRLRLRAAAHLRRVGRARRETGPASRRCCSQSAPSACVPSSLPE